MDFGIFDTKHIFYLVLSKAYQMLVIQHITLLWMNIIYTQKYIYFDIFP